MRVLVTGGSGFVGRQCVARLAEAGHEVHAVHFRSPAAESGGAVSWHKVDLLSSGTASRLLERVRPTHLLHAAWDVEPGRYWSSPLNLRWVGSSLELFTSFAESGGQRAVVVGSCAEYDWQAGQCHESRTPTRPHSLYGACKNALREILTAYVNEAGIGLAWGRLFFLYGPHEPPARLVPSLIQALLAGRPIDLTDGAQVRDFVYVEDVGEALVRLLTSDVEGPVNVASGRGVTLKEVVDVIVERLGGEQLVRLGAKERSAADPALLVADTSRLNDEVGFTPRVGLDDGLARTIRWWASRGGGEEPEGGAG